MTPSLEFFQSKITVEPGPGPNIPEAPGDCWIWHGSTVGHGYPQMVRDGHTTAHRWAFSHFNHPLPPRTPIERTCRNILCVNPAHMRLRHSPDRTPEQAEAVAEAVQAALDTPAPTP